MYKAIKHADEYYEINQLYNLLSELKNNLLECDGILEHFSIEAIQVIQSCRSQELSANQYIQWIQLYKIIPDSLKNIMICLLYEYQYQIEHNPSKLINFYKKELTNPSQIRLAMCAIKHESNIVHNHFHAFELARKWLKKSKQMKNLTGMFDCLHWLCNLSSECEQNEFFKYLNEINLFLSQYKEHISKDRIQIFHVNLAGCYERLKMYDKAIEWYTIYLNETTSHQLPALLFMFHCQFLAYGKFWISDIKYINILDSSDALQACYQYFDYLSSGKESIFLEQYIMKELLPYLKTLHPKFQKIFHYQLQTLIKKTHNYKQLLLFETRLHI